MEEIIEGIMLWFSWGILFFGIIFSIIPVTIYHRIEELSTQELKNKQMLLNYYAIIGITIMIIGFLLVLTFSGKLTFPIFK